MAKTPKVLFLSSGGSARSQMAEGLMKKLADGRFLVASVEIESGSVNPAATEVMAEVGVDISKQHPKTVKESLREHFSYVVSLYSEGKERAPIFPFTRNLVKWDVADPSKAKGSQEDVRNAFRQTREHIKDNVQKLVNEIDKNETRQGRTAAVVA
jgi:arsenate reductase (thioredoxin)